MKAQTRSAARVLRLRIEAMKKSRKCREDLPAAAIRAGT